MRCQYLVCCLVVAYTLGVGDVSMPANATRLSIDPSYTVSYSIVGDSTLLILVESNKMNYFGLGYRDTMKNCDMTIVELVDNSTVTVRDYWSTSYLAPSVDAINNVVLLGWETDFKTLLKVKWARPLITNDPQDNPIEIGTNYVFSLAWSSTPIMSFHEGFVKTFGVVTGEAARFLKLEPAKAWAKP